MKIPNNLKYDREYSWINIEGDTASIGIVEPATKKVKEFVFIKLPQKGRLIKKGENYVSVEAVKWSGHISSPVTGEIIDVNDALFDNPAQINKDPYQSWIMKVKLGDKKELDELLDSKKAEEFYEGKIK